MGQVPPFVWSQEDKIIHADFSVDTEHALIKPIDKSKMDIDNWMANIVTSCPVALQERIQKPLTEKEIAHLNEAFGGTLDIRGDDRLNTTPIFRSES